MNKPEPMATANKREPLDKDIACFRCPVRTSLLCSAFSDDTLAALDAVAERTRLDVGQYLYDEGDPMTHVYNVSHGMLMLERLSSDGRRQVVTFVAPGDFIGLAPGGTYPLSARALTEARLCRFKMSTLEAMFERFPELERRVRLIANRILGHALDHLFVLGRKTAVERLAFFFLHLAQRQGVLARGECVVAVPMTRVDIADFLGVTVETVSRAISRLKADGLIVPLPRHLIEIPDMGRLRAAQDNYAAASGGLML